MTEGIVLDRDLDQQANELAHDPASFFHESHREMQDIDPEALRALQLRALQLRFDELRDKIPMLQKLADKQGITEIEKIEDVVPLLFEHTMYKSYPPVLLEKSRFKDINRWLDKLTTADLTKVDVSQCDTIDEWLDVMERETPLRICHSSGTTGTMSFLPIGHSEFERLANLSYITVGHPYHTDDGEKRTYVYLMPYFTSGGSSHVRMNDFMAKAITGGDETRALAAYPGRMSSDVLYLAGRIRAAQARGDLDRLEISPKLLERKKEFDEIQASMPKRMDAFFEEVKERFAGERIFVGGTWNLVHGIARKGLDRGEEGVFAPDSIVNSGGGAKGMEPPENWQEEVCQFFGVDRISMAYGMSEVLGLHMMCTEGHYHIVPWIVPFVLDSETSQPLPRTGRVTGRAAFYDLTAEYRWGGFISGDEITLNWEGDCSCGRKSAYIVGGIERFSEKNGGDDKITCAATENAHKEAMDFLTDMG